MALELRNKELYGDNYFRYVMEQYKLYVEMADRVSSRRILANSFFLSVQVALITAFTFLLKDNVIHHSALGLAPFAAVLLLCYVWWRVIYSYRQLNSGKFHVIQEIERVLPLALYAEEWMRLGQGRDAKRYRPLTHIESWAPACFGLLYVLLAVVFYVDG